MIPTVQGESLSGLERHLMPKIVDSVDPKGFTYLSDGSICDNATMAVIDAIRSYAPSVDVMYLDPARTAGNDLLSEPWILVEHCPDGLTRKIFGVWDLNMSVLERLKAADSWNTPVLDNIDKHNEAIKKALRDKAAEADAERSDITAHVMASPKGSYSFHGEADEIITISDDNLETRKESPKVF